MIFVDTGGFYAAHVTEDIRYEIASVIWLEQSGNLLTTDYVLDELFTLLRSRKQQQIIEQIGPQFISGRVTDIELVKLEDFEAAWDIFHRYADKEWSFTDCTSFVVMERLGITTAFAFDEHFRQYGKFQVLP